MLASVVCASAVALFQDVRAHTGGARWDAAAGLVAEGSVFQQGLSGRTRVVTDLRSGAVSTADDLGILRARIVSTPDLAWKQDLTGGVHPLDAPDARAKARTDAYLARHGYFRPARDPASMRCLADAAEDGRVLRRVRITPRGGRPVTIDVDPAGHVVVRASQQAPMSVETVHYGAYRVEGGLLLPHEIVETDNRPDDVTTRAITAYRLGPRARVAAELVRPRDPANQRMRGGGAATVVPIDVSSGAPVVEAYVDGRGPLPFLLDTGGHAILTADAAKQLGVEARGGGVSGGAGEGTIAQQFARVRSLRVGDAQITAFPMFVIPYGKEFSDRGAGKPPLAGILGLELFERFAVTIDYARGTLRLQTPRSVVPDAKTIAVRLLFQDDMPLAYARADGVRGLFGIDTGNSGRVILFGDFLRHHGFARRYPNGIAQEGTGSGGIVRTSAIRLGAFTLAGTTVHDFVTGLADQQKGAFSSRTEAGNVGYDVLSQFTVTTDYARGMMYLRPEPAAKVPSFTRSGIGVSRDAGGRMVVGSVVPGSPGAEAGIALDDVVLRVDDVPAETISPADFRRLSRRPAGTVMRLVIRSKGTERDVALVLRELLCEPARPSCSPFVSRASR
ncbi:MAG TPA: aspartyl protease family protein [Candidatus Elarobacter sp.]